MLYPPVSDVVSVVSADMLPAMSRFVPLNPQGSPVSTELVDRGVVESPELLSSCLRICCLRSDFRHSTPTFIYIITTSVLARSEHPVLSAGVSGVPLQAGLAPGNSLHDFPVSPADITQNRCIGPARVGRLHPHVGL